jgi:hypothetical protein
MSAVARLLGVLLAAAAAASCGDGDGGTAAPAACRGLAVVVPDHPFFADPIIAPDPAGLNRLAQQACAEAGMPADIRRVLFGSAPGAIFDEILSRGTDAREIDLAGRLWVLYLSGYFGGIWLRGEIVEAQPDSLLAGFGSVPDREDFLETMDGSRPAVAGAAASDAEAVAYSRGARDDLVDGFGYNKGYLLQILEDPPAGLTSPSDLLRCFGPLDCRYEPLTLPALLDYADVPGRIAEPPNAAWAEVASGIAELQDAAERRGRGVWSSGLSVQGFSQESYEILLDVSAAFLAAVQATALANIAAAAESDGGLARQGAAADAAFRVWIGSYTMGLLDPRDDRELPSYEDG